MDEKENLLAQLIHNMDPNAMVTKFVVIAEGFDETGQRAIYTATHDNAKTWDVLGLLSFALARENAGVARELNREE